MTGKCRRFRKLGLSLLLTVLLAGLLPGQAPFLNPQHRHMENGLPSNFVRDVQQDSKGFIWISTEEGLCRFDGTVTKVYQHDADDPHSLSHNRVYNVLEDTARQALWVATADGLSILHHATGRFSRHYADLEAPDSLPDNTVRYLLATRQGDIWISTWAQGLVRYDAERERFERHRLKPPPGDYDFQSVNPTRINSISMMAQDVTNDSILWLATMAGLVRFNTYAQTSEFFYHDLPTDNLDYLGNSMVSVLPHRDGFLYTGSFATAARFDPAEATFSVLLPPGQQPTDPLRWNFVLALHPKGPEEVWITYRQGVMAYHGRRDTVGLVQANDAGAKAFYGVWLVDGGGRMWNGTEKQGLFMYDPLRQQFRRYPFPRSRENLDYLPQRILESPDGRYLFVAVEGGEGLYRMDRLDSSWTVIPPEPGYFDRHASFEGVDLAWDDAGRLLVLESNRLYRLSPRSDRLLDLPLPVEPGTHRFRRILFDRHDNVWFTSRREGVYRMTRDLGAAQHYQETLNDATTTNQFIWVEHIFEDSRGRIWIRLARSFCIYEPWADRFIRFPYQAGEGSNTYRWLSNFAEDQQGRVWVASMEEGVGLTDPAQPERGIIRRFSTADGLLSNQIIAIAADAAGHIWALSSEGLSQINTRNLSIRTFGPGYGIPPGANVLQLLQDGQMAIGYAGGIALFDPRQLRPNDDRPKPYLTSIKVFDQELSSLSAWFNEGRARLSYRQNFFSFEFSSINYSIPEQTTYTYKLDGFDEDWIAAGRRRYAAYTNVPGGDYVFRVRAANNEGLWSEQPVTFAVQVATPWWKTLWFRLGAGLTLLVLIYGLYRYRVMEIRREERMRSGFEKKLASTEMSALRAQMNPHFVFNCLNSIDYYIVKNETEKASDYLNRFSRLIRLILQNSSSNSVSLRDELEALKLYMEMESMRFDNKFDYRVQVGRDIDIEQVEVPPMLFQPYVENAIWHGLMHKEGKGTVELSLQRENGNLKCIIEDDGIGREQAQALRKQSKQRRKSMGMRLTRDRIDLLNRLHAKNTRIQVIDLVDAEGKARGTRVELQIPL